MDEEKIISSEGNKSNGPEKKIAGRIDATPQATNTAATFHSRITGTTLARGLKQLPENFDDAEGDWKCIHTTNPFEVLYFDYRYHELVTPEIVKSNYDLLYKFWKSKCDSIGANRDRFEKKYNIRPFEKCLELLQNAWKKLNTKESILNYYQELNNERVKKGEEGLQSLLKIMTNDGIAEPGEMESIFEIGKEQSDLTEEEIATIIRKCINGKNYQPYGVPGGKDAKAHLLSVSWMAAEKLKEKAGEEEEKKKRGREIFDKVFAYSVEDIGKIIFERETEAKQYIKENLLNEIIKYFSAPKANQYNEIVRTQKNEQLRFLQICYRLNPTLPYRLTISQLAKTPKELATLLFEAPDNGKAGIEQLKNGNIEVWLQETNPKAYEAFLPIRNYAKNLHLAFLQLIYTYNPALPYRFAGKLLIKSPAEIVDAIQQSKETWEAGKTELFNLSIPVWLKTTGNGALAKKWEEIQSGFEGNEDAGLETFLHLVNEQLVYAKLAPDKTTFSFPNIPSGEIIKAELTFTNATRGYANAALVLSNTIQGISLSAEKIIFNSAAAINTAKVTLSIDTKYLPKGVTNETIIRVSTTTGQKINIPVSFTIVFPKKAFLLEAIKYGSIAAAFFILVRLIIASISPDWLKKYFQFYISLKDAYSNRNSFSVFGWALLFFIIGSILALYLLRKYLVKKSAPLVPATAKNSKKN